MLFVLLALIAFCLAQCFKQKALPSMVEFMDLKFMEGCKVLVLKLALYSCDLFLDQLHLNLEMEIRPCK